MTAPAAAVLAEHAAEIRRLGKQTVENIVEIGRHLVECKRIVGHGNWLPWLDREFGWSDRTALNFIRVAELSKSETVSDLNLPVKALYLLAAPSTPKVATEEIIERAQAGETLSVAEAKGVIADAKGHLSRKARNKATPKAKEKPPHDDDIAPPSTGEAERLRVRVEALQADKRRLEIKIAGLESKIEEAKAAAKPRPGSKPASRCSICGEKKQAEQRPVFICDRCVEIHDIREAAPAADDGHRGTGASHG